MPEPLGIGSTRVIAIVRFHEGGDLAATLAGERGGVDVVEITLDTPGALAAVADAASKAGPSASAPC